MMKKLIAVALFGLGMLTALPAAAQTTAQTACDARAKVVEQLERAYKEVPQALGLSSNGSIVEVFASPSGSWSIVVTSPNGVSCLVASGEAWERLPVQTAGPAA